MVKLIHEHPRKYDALRLAGLCGVSERAIYRYLVTLMKAEIYIVSRRTKGQTGYELVSDYWNAVFTLLNGTNVDKRVERGVRKLLAAGMREYKEDDELRECGRTFIKMLDEAIKAPVKESNEPRV